MAQVTVSVVNGQTVSSQFVLDGRGSKLAVFVPSHAAVGWHIAFAPQSGGPFHRLTADTGAPWVVFSGTGPATARVTRVSQFGRIETSSQATTTTSVTLVEQSWTA